MTGNAIRHSREGLPAGRRAGISLCYQFSWDSRSSREWRDWLWDSRSGSGMTVVVKSGVIPVKWLLHKFHGAGGENFTPLGRKNGGMW